MISVNIESLHFSIEFRHFKKEQSVFRIFIISVFTGLFSDKTMKIYTLNEYKVMLEQEDTRNVEGIVIDPEGINLFLNKKIILDICSL